MNKYDLMESTVKVMLLGNGKFIEEAEECGTSPEVVAEIIYKNWYEKPVGKVGKSIRPDLPVRR